jgi:hypothetical protein
MNAKTLNWLSLPRYYASAMCSTHVSVASWTAP